MVTKIIAAGGEVGLHGIDAWLDACTWPRRIRRDPAPDRTL